MATTFRRLDRGVFFLRSRLGFRPAPGVCVCVCCVTGAQAETADGLALQEGTKTYNILGLDAGTENNSEKRGFLGSLGGGNARDPENGLIRLHEGITGRGDAPASWNWSSGAIPANQNPVARVTITPVDVPTGS